MRIRATVMSAGDAGSDMLVYAGRGSLKSAIIIRVEVPGTRRRQRILVPAGYLWPIRNRKSALAIVVRRLLKNSALFSQSELDTLYCDLLKTNQIIRRARRFGLFIVGFLIKGFAYNKVKRG